MAYRLRPREPIARGLRRLAKKELEAARDELRRTNPPRDEAIHEARKSVKKVRAILQLINADEGGGLADSQKRLRKVNRTLSQLRDADVMLETLTKLRKKNPDMLSEHSFARMRRRLSSHKQASLNAARDDQAWTIVDQELREVRRGAKRWRPKHRRFGALAAGIRGTVRQGRKALARAQKRQRSDDFHELRKHIKSLWYELRLVEGSTPAIRKDVSALHRAETCLGDDHNVVVLCEELSKDATICDGSIELERLRQTANRYQCDLRKKAVASIKRIYAPAQNDYLRRVKRAWKEWQRHERANHRPRRKRAT